MSSVTRRFQRSFRFRMLASLTAAAVLAAGGAQAGAKTRTAPPAARLIPPLHGPDVATLGVERDGTRRIVAFGLRVLAYPDGGIDLARQSFPLARNIQSIELPPRLGGGYLFSVVNSGRTAVWKALAWTSALQPFAELDFELERWSLGYDRVYVQARRTGEWGALDPATGRGVDLGSLPAAPNYGAMAFVDEWLGAVELPVRGSVVSFDAGASWHPLGVTTLGLGVHGSELLVVTPEGRRMLGQDGALRAFDGASALGNEPTEDEPRRVTPEGPLGRVPLALAVTRGYPESADSAIVAAGGALARVRLRDGRVTQVREKLMSQQSRCTALPLRDGFGFVCGEPHGKTEVHAFEPPFGLRRIDLFETPRAVVASGNGGFVVRGRCGPRPADALPGAHCVYTPRGERWVLDVPGDSGVERVVALSDGTAALIAPPRLGAPGKLTIIDSSGRDRSVALRMGKRDAAAEALVSKGFWLDGMVEAEVGTLAGWVSGHNVFAGIRVGLDGQIRVGPLQQGIERAILSGERGLVVPATGIAEQTTDAGQSWSDVDLPTDIELDTSKAPAIAAGRQLEQGCSAVGCSFLGWLRIGWTRSGSTAPLAVVPSPEPTVLPSPGGGRWALRCASSGESSPKVVPTGRVRSAAEASEEARPSSWLPLVERAPPPLPDGALGFDTGTEAEFRAYVWAPRGAEFGKSARWLAAFVDPYRVRGGVWGTRAAATPWADAVQAGEVFGHEGSTPSVWSAALEPSGRAAVLSVTARGTTDLFAVEEDRAPQLLVNASRSGIGTVTSAVRVNGSFYVSAQEDGRSFRVFALENGQARLVGQYTDVAVGRSVTPTLVRSTRGDALAIWARGNGWYLYPVDAASGRVDRPIEVRPTELSRMPRACAPDEEGYLVDGPVGIDPYADFIGAPDVAARAFEGRFVVSAHGICLSELAARAEHTLDKLVSTATTEPSTTQASVSLVLSDRNAGGRRHGFRCIR